MNIVEGKIETGHECAVLQTFDGPVEIPTGREQAVITIVMDKSKAERPAAGSGDNGQPEAKGDSVPTSAPNWCVEIDRTATKAEDASDTDDTDRGSEKSDNEGGD